MSLKIGADPELFCYDTKAQKYISAHPFFPGSKSTPFEVEDGALQLDGLAAELNINPVQSGEDFNRVIQSVMNTAKKFLPVGVTLLPTSSVVFDKEYYDSIPKKAKVIGCTPDFNAWNYGLQNIIPDLEVPSLRAAGGHIHLGFLEKDMEEVFNPFHMNRCCDLVKQLDYIVGTQTTIWDNDNQRRLIYGKAGAFRPKKYGLEYRTPSNIWLESSDKIEQIFNLTKKAYEDFEKGVIYEQIFPFFNVQEAINSGNKHDSQEILSAVSNV